MRLSMLEVVGMLLAAKAPNRLPLRAAWPLHVTLNQLMRDAELDDLAGHLPSMSFKPDPDVGMIEEAAVRSVHELIDEGVLHLTGDGWEASLEVADGVGLRRYRRLLM